MPSPAPPRGIAMCGFRLLLHVPRVSHEAREEVQQTNQQSKQNKTKQRETQAAWCTEVRFPTSGRARPPCSQTPMAAGGLGRGLPGIHGKVVLGPVQRGQLVRQGRRCRQFLERQKTRCPISPVTPLSFLRPENSSWRNSSCRGGTPVTKDSGRLWQLCL